MDDMEQVRGYVFTVARNLHKNLVRDRARETLEGELSVREIARQTNVTEANVKVRIHRAKERLREELKG